ncbi:hypothetical protein [Spirosoma terrae]|uniref:Uncharacterized protein n=1 Tax=Spirosoma terrae TaxID=1968276 RepID=A0A6L9LQR8_9BACT|nr:hypothetical protein [Spirosoma terrae]NDU99329.1 hypothetical protein [Spirosoma terrae]
MTGQAPRDNVANSSTIRSVRLGAGLESVTRVGGLLRVCFLSGDRVPVPVASRDSPT